MESFVPARRSMVTKVGVLSSFRVVPQSRKDRLALYFRLGNLLGDFLGQDKAW